MCPRDSRYVIELADINQPISECAMYFYIGFIEWGSPEKTLQVVIQRAQPIPVENGYPSPVDQVLPSLYRWVVRGTNGNLERAWFSGFIRGRDGLYHTVVTQSQDEWLASYLEIFFEDVNDDGAREDVTYEVPLAQFLPTKTP
jgi:hypothetical protein